jgi:hypothetical protein
LCRAIKAGKKSEQKSEALTLKLKLEFPPVAESFVVLAPSNFIWAAAGSFLADSLSSKPPLPPPRSFLV